MKTRILLGLCILLISTISMAQVPSTINFQGVLSDASDDPIEGTFSMTFRMYDADVDGNMVWEEVQSSVVVTKGLFNAILGSVEPLNIEFNNAFFLSVQKGSEAELSPRITLTSVPSSINTTSLRSANNIIPTSGNVGIGTISPTETLDIDGKIRIRGGTPGAGKVLTSNTNGVATWETASSGIAEINSSGGKIGIGTTTQKVKLSVNGKTYIKGDGDHGTGDTFTPTIDLSIDDSDTGFEVPTDGVLTMFSNNQERMRITNSGQVAIGTTAPNTRLHVSSPATQNAMRVQVDGNTKFFIASDGQVAIGGFFEPSYPLHVAGQVAGTSFVNTSDKRWKNNIKTFENGLEKVLALRGVTYDWRLKEFPNKGFKKGTQLGFIAQEVEKVLPELITTDEQGFKSVKYANITAVLVEAIKEQQEIIESLQDELSESKKVQTQFAAELTELKSMVLKEIRKQSKKSLTASN